LTREKKKKKRRTARRGEKGFQLGNEGAAEKREFCRLLFQIKKLHRFSKKKVRLCTSEEVCSIVKSGGDQREVSGDKFTMMGKRGAPRKKSRVSTETEESKIQQ